MAKKKKMMVRKKGIVRSLRGRPRAYGELQGAKPRMFRASPDVGELLEKEIERTGQTQSAIIDEGLRRVFWSEARYAETLVRNFGGSAAFALSYLLGRVAVGVEHDARSKGASEAEIALQVAAALVFLIKYLYATNDIGSHDQSATVDPTLPHILPSTFPISALPIPNYLAQYIAKPALATQADQEAKSLSTVLREVAAMQSADFGSLETWQRIIVTVDRNLTRGDDLWWPLSDVPESSAAVGRPLIPLRPSLVDLRLIWLGPRQRAA